MRSSNLARAVWLLPPLLLSAGCSQPTSKPAGFTLHHDGVALFRRTAVNHFEIFVLSPELIQEARRENRPIEGLSASELADLETAWGGPSGPKQKCRCVMAGSYSPGGSDSLAAQLIAESCIEENCNGECSFYTIVDGQMRPVGRTRPALVSLKVGGTASSWCDCIKKPTASAAEDAVAGAP